MEDCFLHPAKVEYSTFSSSTGGILFLAILTSWNAILLISNTVDGVPLILSTKWGIPSVGKPFFAPAIVKNTGPPHTHKR